MSVTTIRTEPASLTAPAESDARRGSASASTTHPIFLDLDTTLLAIYQGRRGLEIGVQADVAEGLDRLSQITDTIVIVAHPAPPERARVLTTDRRLTALRHVLGDRLDDVIVMSCQHELGTCECAKPGSGLIADAFSRHSFGGRGGWYIGADQEGVVAGRNAGLRTVRIGPLGVDHLSTVHRPDYEARDLLDAANHILVEELA